MNDDRHDESSETPEWRVAGDEQLESDAYHVWKPRPLLRSVHWKPVPAPGREAAAGSYDVFIDQRAFKAVHQHLWNAGPGESPLGFLVGDLCEDPDTGRRYVIVSAAVPSQFPLYEEGPDQIKGEALVAMQLEVDRRRGVLAGWYHRHMTGPVALTPEDVQTHERHFPEPWQIALLFVTDYEQPAGGCFRRARGGLAGDVALPLFEMVSNESLLARGVRRSHMDWRNVETVDSIDLDLLARPEPAPESEADVGLVAVPEPVGEPAAGAEPEAPVEDGQDEVADLAATPEPATGPSDEDEGYDAGPAEGVEGAPTVLDGLAPDLDLGLAPDLDADADLEPLEEQVPVIEPGEIMAELEEAESELTLPVLDDLAQAEPEAGLEPDAEAEAEDDIDLPEPGWDSGDGAVDSLVPAVEDVDLDSFVTEVETADVATQVDEALDVDEIDLDDIDLDEIEPGWDDGALGDSPVVAPLPVPDVAETDGVDSREAEEEPEDSEARPAVEPEPKVTPKKAKEKKSGGRSRRPMVVGGILVAVAIAASLWVFVFSSDVATEETGAPDASQVAGMEPGEGESGTVVEDPPVPDPSTTEDPGEAAAAVDSLGPAATVDDIEALGDLLLESISRYYGLAVAEDGGQATCADLQASYVDVEERWIAYNVQGRARFRGRLPDAMATRDERLYEGVQDVEREFTRSGCERP